MFCTFCSTFRECGRTMTNATFRISTLPQSIQYPFFFLSKYKVHIVYAALTHMLDRNANEEKLSLKINGWYDEIARLIHLTAHTFFFSLFFYSFEWCTHLVYKWGCDKLSIKMTYIFIWNGCAQTETNRNVQPSRANKMGTNEKFLANDFLRICNPQFERLNCTIKDYVGATNFFFSPSDPFLLSKKKKEKKKEISIRFS